MICVIINFANYYSQLHQLVSKTRYSFQPSHVVDHMEEETDIQALVMCKNMKRQYVMNNRRHIVRRSSLTGLVIILRQLVHKLEH